MVLPIVAMAGTALAGALGGSLANSALSKKGNTDSHNTTTTSTTTDSRSMAIQYPTYQIQIDSPMASQTTKKEASSSAESTPSVSAVGGSAGLDLSQLMPVALVIGGAIVIKEMVK